MTTFHTEIKNKFLESVILDNDIDSLIALLQNENTELDPNSALRFTSINGNIDVFKILLNDRRANPSEYNNYAIRLAAQNGHFKIVELLLNDDRVNPTDVCNYAICAAYKNGYIKITNLLWNSIQVKCTLQTNASKIYKQLIQQDLLKSKIENF
jgi:ankyrin repeat protein